MCAQYRVELYQKLEAIIFKQDTMRYHLFVPCGGYMNYNNDLFLKNSIASLNLISTWNSIFL